MHAAPSVFTEILSMKLSTWFYKDVSHCHDKAKATLIFTQSELRLEIQTCPKSIIRLSIQSFIHPTNIYTVTHQMSSMGLSHGNAMLILTKPKVNGD